MNNVRPLSILIPLTLLVFLGSGLRSSAQTTTGSDPEISADSTVLVGMDSTLRVEAWRAGIYLGLNRTIYSADNMEGLPGIPNCCPGFNSGGGLGIAAGAMAETPLNEWISVGGRLYVNTYNGALVHEETEIVDDEGFATEAVFEHRIDADIWGVSIEPIILFDLEDEVKLFTGLRGDVIVRKLFDQKETILEPSNLVFENGKTTRLEFDGTIPNGTSFHGSIVLGARYDFYIDADDEWVISPEISGWYSPTPVVENESWKIHGIRLALIAQFLRYDQEEKILEDIPPPSSSEDGVSMEDDPVLPAKAAPETISESGDATE